MRAGRARAAAHVGGAGVAVVGAGRAARLEDVRRANGARAVAAFRQVALARRRAAHRARVPGRVRAGGRAGGAVAHVGGADVAIIRAGRPRRLDGVGRTRRAGARAAVGQVALVGRRAADRGARREAARGRAARARRAVRRPLVAVLARVDDAVAAIRIRLVGGDVRRPVLARDRGPGLVGIGSGDDLVLRVDVEDVPAAVHPREGRVGAAVTVVAGSEGVAGGAGDADGAEEELGRLGGGGGEARVRRGAATVAGTGLVQRPRLGEARELVGGEHSSGSGRRERDRDGVWRGQGADVVGGEDDGANRARPHAGLVHGVGVPRRVGGAEARGAQVSAHEAEDDAVTGGHGHARLKRDGDGRSGVVARRRPDVLDERDAGVRFGCREAEQEGERQRRRGARRPFTARIAGHRSRGQESTSARGIGRRRRGLEGALPGAAEPLARRPEARPGALAGSDADRLGLFRRRRHGVGVLGREEPTRRPARVRQAGVGGVTGKTLTG